VSVGHQEEKEEEMTTLREGGTRAAARTAAGLEPTVERAGRWAFGGLLVLALSLVALGGDDARAIGYAGDGSGGSDGGMGGPGSGDGGAPPKLPPSKQDCMGDYLANMLVCKMIACSRVNLLFFNWETCDDILLEPCVENAQTVFEACMEAAA
jgi:hypothetical protein